MQLSDHVSRRVKLHDLYVLMAVVKAGSMRKAAEHLNTTQPSVSRSIADLERTIGVQLLDRNPRGVEPTEYGRALLDAGAAIFDDLRQAMKNIEFLSDPTSGQVRIGSNPFLASGFVSVLVERLSRRYPRMGFQIAAEPVETLCRRLIDRNLDLLITRRFGPVEDERFEFNFLFDDSTFFVVAGAQSPWARRRKINLAELVNECWVLPRPEAGTGLPAMEAFRSHGLAYPTATVVADNAQVRVSLLATGRFLTIFPASVLQFSPTRTELRVLPVKLPNGHIAVGIVTLKNRSLNPVTRLLIEHARETARPLSKLKR